MVQEPYDPYDVPGDDEEPELRDAVQRQIRRVSSISIKIYHILIVYSFSSVPLPR